jgi:hypothetical protein
MSLINIISTIIQCHTSINFDLSKPQNFLQKILQTHTLIMAHGSSTRNKEFPTGSLPRLASCRRYTRSSRFSIEKLIFCVNPALPHFKEHECYFPLFQRTYRFTYPGSQESRPHTPILLFQIYLTFSPASTLKPSK